MSKTGRIKKSYSLGRLILSKENIVMDTCVLLPYIVSLCWKQKLEAVCGNRKREEMERHLQDIGIMGKIIDRTNKKIVITPHIMMELEALAKNRLGGGRKPYAIFKERMNQVLYGLKESFVEKEDILSKEMVVKFGYADTSLVMLQGRVESSIILSNEHPLISLCRGKGIPALSLDEFVSTGEVSDKL